MGNQRSKNATVLTDKEIELLEYKTNFSRKGIFYSYLFLSKHFFNLQFI